MARTGLEQVLSLPDPLLSYNFDLVIANVPGGGNSRSLAIKCMTTSIPGVQIEPSLVQLHGAEAQFAGRIMYTKNLPFTYLEDRLIDSRTSLLNWFYFARDIRNNSGAFKSEYATIGDMKLYNDKGEIARTIRLYNMFPLTLEDAGMDGASSNPVQITGSFSYDYHEDI